MLEPNTIEVAPVDQSNDKYFGYKFDRTEPATIPSVVEDKTVIKVHYVKDEAQTKELSYTVEYYKDNLLQESDTQVERKTVQILEDDTLTVDKSKINLTNKYVAFKFKNTDPAQIPDTVENGTVIKVYYETNNEKTGYRIEYFYNNEIGKSEYIEVDKNTIVTDADIASKVEENKKENFEHFITLNTPLKVGDNLNANVIKVYYKEQKPDEPVKAAYSIEYYYDNEIDNTKTELAEVEIGTVITKETIQEKANAGIKEGFELLTIINAPLTITENVGNNVIKIFYKPVGPTPVEKTAYRIEYYYDNEIDNSKSEIEVVDVGTVITKEIVDSKANAGVKSGYKLLTIINAPLTVTGNTDNNVIKIFYVEDKQEQEVSAYRIEYYYDNEIDNSKTELIQDVRVGTVVSKEEVNAKITSNIKDGYKYLASVNVPLTVTTNVESNVIKIFYNNEGLIPTPTYAYRIEYYYNNEIDNNKTELVQNVELGTVISKEEINAKATANIKDNYKLLALINVPLTVTENIENNVIKIFYNNEGPIPTYAYKIEYYYDNEIDNSKTELVQNVELGKVISKEEINAQITANVKEGYEYLTTVNLPLTVSDNVYNNVIKVFYTHVPGPDPEPVKSAYSIEYYYDNEIDNSKTELVQNVELGTIVNKESLDTKITANVKEGYKYLSTVNVPLTVTENVENNIIKIFYVTLSGPTPVEKTGYRIEYYYDNEIDFSRTELFETVVGTVVTKAEIEERIAENTIKNYEYLDAINVPLTASSNIENNIIKVFYIKSSTPIESKAGYRVEYYYNGQIDNDRSELITVEKGTQITEENIQERISANTKEGYRFLSTINLPLTVSENISNNVIKIFYTEITPEPIENKSAYRIEYYYDYEIDKSKSQLIEVDKGTVISKEEAKVNAEANLKEGYKLIKIANVPLTVTENINNNVIKVYYIKDSEPVGPTPEPDKRVAYSIEYYYANEIDNQKTELLQAEVGTVIEKAEIEEKAKSNLKEGYRFLGLLNVPLTIEEDIENNIIKVYYVAIIPDVEEKVGYKIEYYYDEEIDNDKSELIEVDKGAVITKEDIVTKAEENKEEGYELLDIVRFPLTATENIDNNVIKVFYGSISPNPGPDPEPVQTETRYRLEYYYENEIDNDKTELIKVEKGTTVERSAIESKITINKKDGYRVLDVINVPLKVTDKIENNIIKIFYILEEKPNPGPDPTPIPNTDVGYRIEYYYDKQINNDKSELIQVEKDTVISMDDISEKVEANKASGYKLLDILNVPLKVSEKIEDNVLSILY